MNGLGGARVLLLDDEPKEALPVITAFSKIGVPIAYFDGTELPKERYKLRGVRLAILDMDLGVGGSPENKASTVVNMLSGILSSDNGPYGLLFWTKHSELRDIVTQFIYARSHLPKPVFVIMLQKAHFNRRSRTGQPTDQFSTVRLSRELLRALTENSPLECMQVWEGSCFEAATKVTNGIGELTTSAAMQLDDWRRDWREETLKLLFTISRAKAEKHHSVENCIPSMFLALNPLHTDRMDLLVEGVSAPLAKYATQIMSAQGGSATERKAKVNSMLHLGSDHLDRFEPGNFYVMPKHGKPTFIPGLQDLLRDTIHPDTPENRGPIVRDARIFAVEVTPVCDYAQDKMGFSRLCVGFLLPLAHEKKIKNAQFLKRLGPFHLSSRMLSPSAYNIYFNSRYVASAKPSDVKKLKPVVRVRFQLLADVQSWLAYQSSRQGVMLLG